MESITITNANPTLGNLHEVLSRIVDQYQLVWNEDESAIAGNGILANIDFEETKEGKKPVSVTIKSPVYAPQILEEVAGKVKGNGFVI